MPISGGNSKADAVEDKDADAEASLAALRALSEKGFDVGTALKEAEAKKAETSKKKERSDTLLATAKRESAAVHDAIRELQARQAELQGSRTRAGKLEAQLVQANEEVAKRETEVEKAEERVKQAKLAAATLQVGAPPAAFSLEAPVATAALDGAVKALQAVSNTLGRLAPPCAQPAAKKLKGNDGAAAATVELESSDAGDAAREESRGNGAVNPEALPVPDPEEEQDPKLILDKAVGELDANFPALQNCLQVLAGLVSSMPGAGAPVVAPSPQEVVNQREAAAKMDMEIDGGVGNAGGAAAASGSAARNAQQNEQQRG